MNKCVLDASAVVVLIKRKPGSSIVEAALPQAMMSAVNIAEVVRVLCRSFFTPDEAATMLNMLIGDVVSFERSHAYQIGSLQGLAHVYGLSLGDCVCLSLAKAKALPVLTADTFWSKLTKEIDVDVQVIR